MVSSSCSTTITVLPRSRSRTRVSSRSFVVALVETDGRFVEDVEDADQTGTDLAGQPDALTLAARQGGRAPGHGEVVEADVQKEPEPDLDLAEDPVGDQVVAFGQLQGVDPGRGGGDGESCRARRC